MDALTSLVERLSRSLLDLDPDGREKLAGLKGRIFCLEVTAPKITLYLIPDDRGLGLASECDGEPDVTLTGPLSAFMRLARPEARGNLSTDARISLRGDAEAGQALGKALSRLDIDWEEGLSKLIGDTPARKTGNILRDLNQWAVESVELSRSAVAEYLQEEKQLLATNLALERFCKEVNDLRADVDRVEQRTLRLLALKNGSSADNPKKRPGKS